EARLAREIIGAAAAPRRGLVEHAARAEMVERRRKRALRMAAQHAADAAEQKPAADHAGGGGRRGAEERAAPIPAAQSAPRPTTPAAKPADGRTRVLRGPLTAGAGRVARSAAETGRRVGIDRRHRTARRVALAEQAAAHGVEKSAAAGGLIAAAVA